MLKRLIGLAVLSGVLSATVMAMTHDEEKVDNARVEAVIDARLHQLLIEMRMKHALTRR